MSEPNYSEKIEFSKLGTRLAVIKPNGRLVHLDNWDLDMFGGVLPATGDHFTTLWDPERPEPAECYEVVSRHWIGELNGDNCWWLLLKEVEPTATAKLLFRMAREQSRGNRPLSGNNHTDLFEIRDVLKKSKRKLPRANANAQRKRPPA